MGFDSKHDFALLPYCWGFSFALGCGVSYFGGIQHSPVNGCSAVSCNFGVLAGKDEHMCFYSTRWRSYIQSAKIRPGADCGSDHELLIAKFILKLKKVGKTNRSFMYDLNQIPDGIQRK